MDLYALPPGAFTAARDAEAKRLRGEGDREAATAVAALRRPTASAHAVNALVRADPDLLTQLLDLGAALADAQRGGAGDALRALGAQRRQLVEAVADRAVEAAGGGVGAAARTEVVATLEAALADTASAEAVRSGRLVRALSYAGFGGVDLDGAVAPATGAEPAAPGPGAEATGKAKAKAKARGKGKGKANGEDEAEQARRAEAAARLQAAERAALDAQGALDDAVRAGEAATREAEAAVAAREAADEAVASAEAALHAAREDRQRAQAAARDADAARTRAGTHVERAQAEAERARAELDRLRRS